MLISENSENFENFENSENFESNIQGDVEIEQCLVTLANISSSNP